MPSRRNLDKFLKSGLEFKSHVQNSPDRMDRNGSVSKIYDKISANLVKSTYFMRNNVIGAAKGSGRGSPSDHLKLSEILKSKNKSG